MSEAPDTGPDDAPPDSGVEQDRPGARSLALPAAVAAATLFGLLAVVLGVLVARGGPDPDAEVRRTAGRFGEALLTFDHTDPDANRVAVLDLATGGFRSDYDEAFSRGIGELISEVEASSRAFVKEVFVSAVDDGQAEAIVLLDLAQDGAGGPRTLFDVYFQLSLVRVDGRWLVDGVINLNLADQGSAVAPAPPGTTEAPVP